MNRSTTTGLVVGIVFVVAGAIGLILPNRNHGSTLGPLWFVSIVLVVVGVISIVMALVRRSRKS